MNTTPFTLQAKILGLSIIGIGLLGITIASPLQISTPTLDAIKIGKIFLSTSGTATTSGNSNITLDGSNGSVELKGNLTMPGYGTRCTSNTGCILTTDADGIVQFATINISQRINHHTGTIATPQPNFFTRRGGNTAQVDTGASEIVFYDRTIIGNNANSDVSLRIGLSGAINSASQGNSKTVDVAGPIMSRTALSLESPIDVSKSADYPFSPNRTSAVIQKSTSSDTIEAMKLQVGHTSDDGASYDRSDFIIESLSNSIKAKLGINTPNYPSKELDINGQTLSRGNLTVGSGTTPTFFANTSTKKVGINTTPSRATFDVNGSSKFNGSLSILGTPANIANITNGMTSITLGEIKSNETGNLRTLADVGCKLLTVDSNGNLVLEQIPDHICRGTSTPVQPATTPTCDRYLPFTENSISNECTLKIKRNGGNNVSTVSVTAIVANHDSYDFTIATGQSLSTEEIVINESCANLQIGITGQNSCNNYFRGSGFGLCELNDGDSTLPSSTLGQLISKKEYFCTDANGGRYADNFCPQPKPTLSYLGNQNSNNRQACSPAPQACTTFDTTHGCFVEDTLVTLADGSTKKIQDIVIGDILKGISTNNTVISLIRPQLGNKLLYSINGSDAFVTPNHPFLTTDGWKSLDPDATRKEIPDLTVGLLKIGDILITQSGLMSITSLVPHTNTSSTQLYNFELNGDHTYFANGFAVHNKEAALYGSDTFVPLLPNNPNRTLLRSESCTRNSDCRMVSPRGSNDHTSTPSFAACDGVEKVCGGDVVPNRISVACACTQPTSCTTDSQCCGGAICKTTGVCQGYKVVGSTGPYEGQQCSELSQEVCHSEAYGQSPRLHHGCQRRETTTKTCQANPDNL